MKTTQASWVQKVIVPLTQKEWSFVQGRTKGTPEGYLLELLGERMREYGFLSDLERSMEEARVQHVQKIHAAFVKATGAKRQRKASHARKASSGAKPRAKLLSKQERSRIASRAAKARWAK